ncbi:MAG: hypothetical protein P3B98_10720 [Gemmatimonadota bacterium]|nr:hypothetical protein [Gemmatimonadota bacterium]
MRFAAHLQTAIDAIEEDEILILCRIDANVFVQLMRVEESYFLEAVSNQYIGPPTYLLDEQHFARAVQLGWLPPNETDGEAALLNWMGRDVVGSPNFYRQWPRRVRGVAQFLVKTLQQVYGLRGPGVLEYSSFHRHGLHEIRWPMLNIPRYSKLQRDEEAEAREQDDAF